MVSPTWRPDVGTTYDLPLATVRFEIMSDEGGGVPVLVTVTVMGDEVVVLPAASRAVAVSI